MFGSHARTMPRRFDIFRHPLYRQNCLYSSVKFPPPYAHYHRKRRSYFKPALLFFIAGAALSYNYSLYELGERRFPLPLTSDSKSISQFNERLESRLQALPIVKELRTDPNFVEYRDWNHLDSSPTGLSNFHGTLRTPGGISIPPLSFHCQETGDDIVIVHVGRRISGYPFLVHGGMLGMLVDEIFKSNLIKEFPNLTFDNVHTKSLDLKFKSPTFVNQFLIIKSNSAKLDTVNNDYIVNSHISTTDGKVLVQASAVLSTDTNSLTSSVPTRPLEKKTNTGWFW